MLSDHIFTWLCGVLVRQSSEPDFGNQDKVSCVFILLKHGLTEFEF